MMLALCSFFLAVCVAKVKISEIVPHSDVEDGYYDFMELWNDDDKPADISGHFLTDAGYKPTKCQIKPNTILAPGMCILFLLFLCHSLTCRRVQDVLVPGAY
jgi:hypothetical protein